MERYQLDILGISEVRWTDSGRLCIASVQTLLYSGPSEGSAHEHGVGFLISKRATRCLMEWEPISYRIITARSWSKFQRVTLVQCYSPTNQAEQQAKEDFYEQLQGVIDNVASRDIVLVIGDMNAKVGQDNSGRESVMGREGVGVMNENGELYADFCGNNELVIGGTIFQHKIIHKTTWISPDMVTENQIDHVAISRRWARSLTDVNVCRGADVGSDHYMVLAKLRVKISRVKKSDLQRHRRFDTSKLKNRNTCQDFAITVSNRFQALAHMEEDTVEEKWDIVKETLKTSCEETLGYMTRTHKDWLSEDTKKLIEEKRESKHKLLQAKTRIQKRTVQAEYKTLQKDVKQSAKMDKRNRVDQLATEAQQAAEKGDFKTLYDISRKLSGKRGAAEKPVKSKDGRTLSKPDEQLERWREHFCEILNGTPVDTPLDIPEGEELDIDTGPITKDEIMNAVGLLKNGKAPGLDGIPPEALKADRATTADLLIGLLQDIWNKEEVPKEWRTGLIVKLPKKGDLGDCQNWRGIQLLSLPSKVLTKIILRRIKTAIDGIMRDEQAGFRQGRSCTDQIATLRIIVEQSLEWQSPLYLNFIDFRKAFDTIDRNTIWKIMKHYGVPDKVINIIRSLYQDTSCHVIHNTDLSPPFTVSTGVRQGCLLSPLIFSLVIDWIMKTVTTEPRGLQWTFMKQLEDLDFADDIALLSHTYQHIQDKTQSLDLTAKQTGLNINASKTKTMRVNNRSESQVTLNNQPIEEVESFTYLGSVIDKTGGSDEDVKIRIGKARGAFNSLSKIWNSTVIRRNTKIKIFNSNVKSVLLYGSETWKHSKKIEHKLQVFINGCLRRILKLRWPDRISNEELWRRTKQKPVMQTIKERKWRWIGHILRRDRSSITRQALDWNPQGKRKRGRPVLTWRRTLDTELRSIRLSWGEAKRKAEDRDGWRSVVKALCPPRGEED